MPDERTRIGTALWILQGLLAAIFLFAGGFKLAMPLAYLAKASPLPPLFLKFVSICELAGAFGLILPGIFGVQRRLTPIAAACLVVVMVGAVTVTLLTLGIAEAILPFVVGILAATVAWKRREWMARPTPPRSLR